MYPSNAKRSEAEIELINEFKKFDLTRQRSQESVSPSRFKIKTTKQESTPNLLARPTRISLENDRQRVQSLPRKVSTQISPPPTKPPPPVPRMPDVLQGASAIVKNETLDDEGYLMPEELGIPQHIQKVLNGRGPKSSIMTMPHLRHRENSGSLPNEKYPFRLIDHTRKESTGNLSVESLKLPPTPTTRTAVKVEKKHSRPLPATPPLSIKESLTNYPWFQDISREEAEAAVATGNKDGTFLVRKSKNGGPQSPFTLTLYFQGSTYNLNIRHLPSEKFVLGKKKSNEMVFDSLKELIERHKKLHLKLIDKHGRMKGQVVLVEYPKISNC